VRDSELFPDPSLPYDEGLIAIGGELSFEVLAEAYDKGIFPWPQQGFPMLWFCPDRRGLLDFEKFRIPRSLKRKLKNYASRRISRNHAFQRVIVACARQKRKGQKGSWITPDIIAAYTELFERGHAHSWEVWNGEELVGGGYGVQFKGVFSGESLFHTESDMSKLALIRMVEDLKSEGHAWMDTQMVTPLLALFGAEEVPKTHYLEMLRQRQKEFQIEEFRSMLKP